MNRDGSSPVEQVNDILNLYTSEQDHKSGDKSGDKTEDEVDEAYTPQRPPKDKRRGAYLTYSPYTNFDNTNFSNTTQSNFGTITSTLSRKTGNSNISSINRKRLKTCTQSKWWFILFNFLFLVLGGGILTLTIGTWFKMYRVSVLFTVTNRNYVIIATALGASFTVLSCVGFVGVFMHKKTVMTIYALGMWPLIAMLMYVGFSSYKQHRDNTLETLAGEWAAYGDEGKNTLQTLLGCCGFNNILDAPSNLGKCMVIPSPPVIIDDWTPPPQTLPDFSIPGCSTQLFPFSTSVYEYLYMSSFSTGLFCIILFTISLLTSNHFYKKN